MTRPPLLQAGLTPRPLDPRINIHRPRTPIVRLTNHNLQLHTRILTKHQRRLQRQLPDLPATNTGTRIKRELEQRRARHHNHPQHHMVSQPRMSTQRKTPREQQPITRPQRNRRTQQRMIGHPQPSRSDITRTHTPIQPITPTLKRILRQLHPPRTAALEHRRPIHRHTPHPQLPKRPQHPLSPTLPTTQRTPKNHGAPIPKLRLHNFLRPNHQHRMRTHLKKRPQTIPTRRPHSPIKTNRLTQIAIPVIRPQPPHIKPPTRHSRIKRNLPRTRHNRRTRLQQLRAQLLHLLRVRRVINRQLTSPNPTPSTLLQKTSKRLTRTRNHHRTRPINRRDRELPTKTHKPRPHLLTTKRNRHHPPQTRQPPQRPPPQRHQPRRIPQRQPTRHTRRRDLPLRMTNHRIRTHTTRTPHRSQRHHHRKQHRLNHINTLQPRRTLHPPQHILQRPIHKRRQRLTTPPHTLRKHLRTLQQLNTHTHPLRTLARKHKHNTTLNIRHTTRKQPITLPSQHPKPPQQLLPRTNQHRTMLKHRTRHPQRKPNINTTKPRISPHKPQQPPRLSTQPTPTTPRHHPRNHPLPHQPNTHTPTQHTGGLRHLSLWVNPVPIQRINTPRRHLLPRGFLEDEMRVGATNPKRRNTRPARLTTRHPRCLLGQQRDRASRPIHLLCGLIHMQRPRQHPMLQSHHHLNHPRHPSRGLGMTNIRLHRPQP